MTSIALNDHYERFIKRQLESGRYNNASEIVRAGLRMLEDFEEARENWLKNEVPKRLAEIETNPEIGVPAEKVFARIEVSHRARKSKAG